MMVSKVGVYVAPLLSVGIILFKWKTNTDPLSLMCNKSEAACAIHRSIFAKRRVFTGGVHPVDLLIPGDGLIARQRTNMRITVKTGKWTGCTPFVNLARQGGAESHTGTAAPEPITMHLPPGTHLVFIRVVWGPEYRSGLRCTGTQATANHLLCRETKCSCNFCQKETILLNYGILQIT